MSVHKIFKVLELSEDEEVFIESRLSAVEVKKVHILLKPNDTVH